MIRVLLADDHVVIRQGLRRLLEDDGSITVVGEASEGREAVALARQLAPDVVLMDVSLPGLNGIEATRQIRDSRCGARVLGLSMHDDHRKVVEMLRAGASGYILKNSESEELLAGIRAVAGGGTFVSPRLLGAVVGSCVVQPAAPAAGPWARLSPREREVLQLIAEGVSCKEIAHRLSLSVNTVHSHRRHLMEKLGVRSVAELTRHAIRTGLTDL